MMKRRMIDRAVTAKILTGLVLTTSLLMPACGSDPGDAPSQAQSLELYSWWTAPGETDALKALLDIYRQEHPQTNVINATLSDLANAQAQLKTRMMGGTPPDTFQATGGLGIMQWVAYNGRDDTESKMDPIDELARSQNWKTYMPQPLLDVVTYNSKMYAVPLNIHRFSVLYFNKKVFADNGLTPPSTMSEFVTVAEALQAKGIVPFAMGSKAGWPVSLLVFDGLLTASSIVDFRDSYLEGKEDPADPRLVNVLNDAAKMLSYANANRDAINWDEAAQMVVDGTAAMTVMGDWAKGFFMSKGLTPDVEFGQALLPGTQGVFCFTTDTFGLPKGGPNRQAALDFLTLVGSPKGQAAFNPIKGSTPPRTDADLTNYDVFSKRTAEDFRNNRLVKGMGVKISSDQFNGEVRVAMKQFAIDGKVDAVVNVLKNRYDLLKPQ
jgi:glucose/mannose transport system substrate-binding protein